MTAPWGRIAVLGLALLGAGMTWTTTAMAMEYRVVSCDLQQTDPVPSGGWQTIRSHYLGWQAVADCPHNLTFKLAGAMPREAYASAHLTTGSTVKTIKLTVEGGDNSNGAVYRVIGSPPVPELTLPWRAVGDEPQTIELQLGVPDLTTVGFRVACEQDTCPGTQDLVLRDFEFTLDDATPPSVYSPWVQVGQIVDPNATVPWFNADRLRMRLWATDSGTGVRSLTLGVDDEAWWSTANQCLPGTSWSVPSPCPHSTTKVETSIVRSALTNASLDDGLHIAKVSARDAVGNTTPTKSIPFGFDSVPPSRPASLTVLGANEHGWSREGSHTVSWDIVGENEETATESGVALAKVQVYSLIDGSAALSTITSQRGLNDFSLPSDGRWEAWVHLIDRAGNVGPARTVIIAQDLDTPDPPRLDPLAWLNRRQLIEGAMQRWAQPANLDVLESGICGYSLTYGDEELPDDVPDLSGPAPGVLLPASLADGVTHLRVRAISCAGRASFVATGQLRVDSVPPVVDASSVDPDRWHTQPVVVRVNAGDAHSGVASTTYRLDNAPTVEVEGDTATTVLADGVHELRFDAIDRAGNRSTSQTLRAKVDTLPPTGWVEPSDPAKPAAVTAVVDDGTSGIAEAHLEYARVDAGAAPSERLWRRFGESYTPVDIPIEPVSVNATLPDELVPEGLYRVRVVARDRAGNVGAIATRVGGGDALVSLAARERPSITAALAPIRRRCRAGASRQRRDCAIEVTVERRRARRNLLVAFGTRARLFGELRHADGEPFAGRLLRLYARRKFESRELVAETVTAADGSYMFGISPGVTREFDVRFAGADLARPTHANASLGVRGSASLRISPRRARPGGVLTFSGQLADSSRLPTVGKIVHIQFLTGGRWRPAIDAPRTDLKGRFRLEFPLSKSIEPGTRLKFRLAIPAEDNWPYEDGVSKRVDVVVR